MVRASLAQEVRTENVRARQHWGSGCASSVWPVEGTQNKSTINVYFKCNTNSTFSSQTLHFIIYRSLNSNWKNHTETFLLILFVSQIFLLRKRVRNSWKLNEIKWKMIYIFYYCYINSKPTSRLNESFSFCRQSMNSVSDGGLARSVNIPSKTHKHKHVRLC